ncbi:hypothetical protein BR93DRAFT_328272 [Coniochaeta sp. PMI_546]|nr:hypothetical protein BR93DRAFT_328272 [Coniochaeta sp. PMI_546]
MHPAHRKVKRLSLMVYLTNSLFPLFGCEIQNTASLAPKLEWAGRIEPRRFTASLEAVYDGILMLWLKQAG